MRLFVGVWLSQAMRDEVIRYINIAREQFEGFKWSTPGQLHFTLKFLGEVEENKVPGLTSALDRAVMKRQPFELKLGEPGRFPERGMPRILWIGLSAGEKELSLLAGAVEEACIQAGFQAENRPFTPHLTIARTKKDRSELKVPEIKVLWQSMTLVSGFSLIESRLQSGGAQYRTVRDFSLYK